MNIKLLSGITAFSIGLFSFLQAAQAERFDEIISDVSTEHWAYNSLEKLVKKYNLNIGYKDKTFKGEKNITRYEVASLLAQVLEKISVNNIETEDKDNIKKINTEYSVELKNITSKLQNKIENIENQLDMLEIDHQKTNDLLDNFMGSLPFRLSGDLALRYNLPTPKFGDFSSQEMKMRIALNLESRENDTFNYGVRLLSGNSSKPGYSWWNFSYFFTKSPLNFDRFFVSYKPAKFLGLTFGKFRDPFSNTEIYMDEDINPAGALQTLTFENISDTVKELSFNLGEVLINMSPNQELSYSLNGNASLKLNLSDFTGLNLKAGYFQYFGENSLLKELDSIAKEKPEIPDVILNKNKNTNSVNNGNFKYGFKILNGFGKLVFRLSDSFPLTLSGDYIYNLGAVEDNQAFQAGAKIGTSKEPGNFFVGYNFKYIQKDAVISSFVEDQLGGTDVMAHEGILGIKVLPKTILLGTFQAKNSIKTPQPLTYMLRINLIQGF